MSDALGPISAALYSALSGGTALTTALGGTAIFNTQAPDSQAYPYVVYSYQGGGPENVCPADLQNMVWFVRAYAKGGAAVATGLKGKIDALLDGKTLSISGFTNLWTKREGEYFTVETPPNGEKVWTAGGLYRIRITG